MTHYAHEKMREVLEMIAQEHGISPPLFNQAGICHLQWLSCHVMLEAHTKSQDMYLTTIVADERLTHEHKICCEALKGNLYWKETNDCTLMLDGAQQKIVLCRKENLDALTSTRFIEILELFIETAHAWKERFEAVMHTVPSHLPHHF